MAAGLGFKNFQTGEVLTSADVNGYLMQGVLVFASEAARDAAITSPQEGQFAYTKDNNSLWYYTGSAWAASGATGDIEGVTAGTGISGGGTSGTVTITNSMATEIDAKGDLVVGTGADTFARLAVGTNGHTLVADSVEATGLKWAAPAAGGGMTLLSTFVPSSSTGNSFTGLSGHKHLLLTWVNLIGSSNATTFGLRLNNSSSSIYMDRYLMNATTEGQTSTFITADFSMFIRNADAPGFQNAPRGFLWIYDYESTAYAKSYSGGSYQYDGGFGGRLISNVTGIFNTTSAITSIDIVRTAGSGTFSTANDGVIKLYGVS